MAIDTYTVQAIDLLQALHRGVAGVKYAPPLRKYPSALADTNLPAVLVWPRGGSFYMKGGGWHVVQRQMLVLLYVETLGQNDIPGRALSAITVMDRLLELYTTASTVPLLSPAAATGGYQITIESRFDSPHRDEGVVPNLSFGGAAYYGDRITLNLSFQWGEGAV